MYRTKIVRQVGYLPEWRKYVSLKHEEPLAWGWSVISQKTGASK